MAPTTKAPAIRMAFILAMTSVPSWLAQTDGPEQSLNGGEGCRKQFKSLLTLHVKVNPVSDQGVKERGRGGLAETLERNPASGRDCAQSVTDLIDDLFDKIWVVAFAHHAHHGFSAREADDEA